MANSILVDSLTQLLIEKGIITNEEFVLYHRIDRCDPVYFRILFH